jgi:hypothetical protein
MNDAQKVALLEGTLREVLRINDEASKGHTPGSLPLEVSLEGSLLYAWIDVREKAKGLLRGDVR